ncbi:uncharacterized protein LOC115758046 [Drosophila novamexicana]|uniref:uncharacterized protein LOC115758046 n=1 Tax=Drosophila novamexicana TaxID=47314 RepID=UPI0011E5E50E|nr:uncharacterized protein LOC115758046 [Drosophila novamexicana]
MEREHKYCLAIPALRLKLLGKQFVYACELCKAVSRCHTQAMCLLKLRSFLFRGLDLAVHMGAWSTCDYSAFWFTIHWICQSICSTLGQNNWKCKWYWKQGVGDGEKIMAARGAGQSRGTQNARRQQ